MYYGRGDVSAWLMPGAAAAAAEGPADEDVWGNETDEEIAAEGDPFE